LCLHYPLLNYINYANMHPGMKLRITRGFVPLITGKETGPAIGVLRVSPGSENVNRSSAYSLYNWAPLVVHASWVEVCGDHHAPSTSSYRGEDPIIFTGLIALNGEINNVSGYHYPSGNWVGTAEILPDLAPEIARSALHDIRMPFTTHYAD
jgi:hypothetical protein